MKNKEGIVFNIGDIVDYHSIIGSQITSRGHRITGFGVMGDERVFYVTHKSWCISIESVSHSKIKYCENERPTHMLPCYSSNGFIDCKQNTQTKECRSEKTCKFQCGFITKSYEDMLSEYKYCAHDDQSKLDFAIKWSLIKWKSLKNLEPLWRHSDYCGFCITYTCSKCPLNNLKDEKCTQFMDSHTYQEIEDLLKSLYISDIRG